MDTHTAMALVQNQIAQELHFSDAPENIDAWMEALGAKVNHLIVHDFHLLVTVLYHLDISEKKLRQLLKNEPAADAGKLIAQAMVERQLQKINTRQAFRHNDSPISENERW